MLAAIKSRLSHHRYLQLRHVVQIHSQKNIIKQFWKEKLLALHNAFTYL